ncbi:MAG: M23 family metallopeptidase [Gemmiger sp.]|nr:M23 family metallopeptidase [Gemmiger sp.]
MWENVSQPQGMGWQPEDKSGIHAPTPPYGQGYPGQLPRQTPPPQTPPAPQKADSNLLLWAQLLICGLAVAAVLVLRTVQPATYATLREAFTQALRPESSNFLTEQRQFVKFAMGGWDAVYQAAQEVFAQLTTAPGAAQQAPQPGPGSVATAESAPERTRHGHTASPPGGSSNEAYQPRFALAAPLQGNLCLTSCYGWRADPLQRKAEDFHTGADLAAAEGTPVLAAAGGVVRQARYSTSYGNYLRVLHPGGDETLYAHLQYLFVRPGQAVKVGECLGTVGQTGDATGPHLHFELLHEGVRYDPQPALGLP